MTARAAALAIRPRRPYSPAAMTMPVTLVLLAASLAVLAFSVWKVRQPRDYARPRLILDWHYVMFPAILASGLLALHALMLAAGR